MFCSKNEMKKLIVIILPIIILVLLTPKISLVKKNVGSKYAKIRNKKIKIYLSEKEENVLNSCLDQKESIKYYTNLYSYIINTIYNLEKKKYLKKSDRKILFSILKDGKMADLLNKVNAINLTSFDAYSISKKNLLLAMTHELYFYDYDYIEKFYLNAIKNYKFDIENYLILSKFYKKNCKYDRAINILLNISSIASNSNQKIDLSENYRMLGNLYMAKRDYENALANYINSIIVLDFKDKNSEKNKILVSIGDIMKIRGNNFEAIYYYKYALSLGKFKMKDRISLLLKLSETYYNYGNYEAGLRFAKEASHKSKQFNKKYLHYKAKYFECLNYEYLNEQEKAREACQIALNEAEEYKNENQDFNSYMDLANMLDFASYIRNPELAIEYLKRANHIIRNEDDVYKKSLVLEKIASIKAYHSSPKEKFNVLRMYDELDKIYYYNDIAPGCCNNILYGFIKEQLHLGSVEESYFKAEKQLKNIKSKLATLYVYMSDYYRSQGFFYKALYYAERALEIDSQIYRFDHHYIKYINGNIDNIKNLIRK